jgi:hypothetical protein
MRATLSVGVASLLAGLAGPACLPEGDAAQPDEQLVWRDGTAGAWGGDPVTGAIMVAAGEAGTFELVNIVDQLTGGSPSLQLKLERWSFGAEVGFGYGVKFSLANAKAMNAFTRGRVELDVAIPAGASPRDFELRVNRSKLVISTASVGTAFTRISIPFASIPDLVLEGSFTDVVAIHYKCSYCEGTDGAPMLLINEVKWLDR